MTVTIKKHDDSFLTITFLQLPITKVGGKVRWHVSLFQDPYTSFPIYCMKYRATDIINMLVYLSLFAEYRH